MSELNDAVMTGWDSQRRNPSLDTIYNNLPFKNQMFDSLCIQQTHSTR